MSTIIVPTIALIFYTLMFLALTAVKSNRVVTVFKGMLVCFIFWAGGSMMMRMVAWPGVDFWCKVSIGGMFCIPYLYYVFIDEFIGNKSYFTRVLVAISTLIILILNYNNSLFENAEVISNINGNPEFIFEGKWALVLPMIFVLVMVVVILMLIVKSIKQKQKTIKDYAPIITGIIILALGSLIATIPSIGKFPVDTFACILNAMCLFYALYRRRLFNFTFVITRGSIYLVTFIGLITFGLYVIPYLSTLISDHFEYLVPYSSLILGLIMAAFAFLVYKLLITFTNKIFARQENITTKKIEDYSNNISSTIKLDEISCALVDVIQDTLGIHKVYIYLKNDDKQKYVCACSDNVLNQKQNGYSYESPLVKALINGKVSMTDDEIKRNIWYRSLWENEKNDLSKMHIKCYVPLITNGDMVGMILLGEKEKHSKFTFGNIKTLNFISSISAVAIKNAQLYHEVYLKASLDHLTGILNREFFFSNFEKRFNNCPDDIHSLIILSVDDFSLYNELYGRSDGDLALKGIADIISSTNKKDAICARYSGKEFIIAMQSCDTKSAKETAQMIINQVHKGFSETTDEWEKNLTFSVGICTYPFAAGNLKDLIDYTEMAVYHAKQNGKNQIVCYTTADPIVEKYENKTINSNEIYGDYASMVSALTAAIDIKDSYTCDHSSNVSNYAAKLAKAYGLSDEHIELVKEAGLLHDIGKIGIPENILNKPAKLTDEEYEIMKKHVENSISIIRHLPSLNYVIPAVIGHHERWDGTGYPRRLKGEEIPLLARCLCIADAYDALTTERSYRKPVSNMEALAEIKRHAGSQFDAKLVDIFIEIMKD